MTVQVRRDRLIAIAAPLLCVAGLLAASAEAANPMVWAVWDEGPVWQLGFSPAESDNIAIAFSCRRGSGRIKFEAPVASDFRGKTIALTSGAVTRSYRATLEPDGEIFDQWAVAEAPSSDPVLTAFARTGRLRFTGGEAMEARSPKERAEIARFFKACG